MSSAQGTVNHNMHFLYVVPKQLSEEEQDNAMATDEDP